MTALRKRRVILAKIETTHGTDINPVKASDAILCRMSSTIDPQGEDVALNNARTVAVPEGHVVAGAHIKLSIEVDLRGGDGADTPPECDALLQACGLEQTIANTVSVTYSPYSDLADHKSCTIYWYEDGRLHKALGCRGNVSLQASNQQIGSLTFAMSGLWVDAADESLPSPTILELTPPVVQGGTFTIAGDDRAITSFSLDFQNEVVQKGDVNEAEGIASFEIVGRKTSGSIDPEDIALNSLNPWSDWKNGTTKALVLEIGSDAGNTITVNIPDALYQRPSYSDRNGIRTYSLNFVCIGDADDEATIVFT